MQLIIDELEAINRLIDQKSKAMADEELRRTNLKSEIEAINVRLRTLDEAQLCRNVAGRVGRAIQLRPGANSDD